MSKSHFIIPVFVPDLGCPHQCVFCNQKKITGHNDVPGADEVTQKIAGYLKTIPRNPGTTVEVAFYGGSFTAVDPNLQAELLARAYQFVASHEIDSIRVSTRPDAVSEDIMALLSTYGVGTVELGVQSMDDEVLWLSGRGHTSRDVLRASALIKEWGVNLGFQIMVGLPGDTEDKEINSALELISLRPDLMRIYPCLVLKDTPLAELYGKGEYVPLTVEQAVWRCKILLLMFERAGVNVIRIGLQPSEQINLDGDVLAGPYHPAFRELVETAVIRDQLEYLFKDKAGFESADMVEVVVPETDVSWTKGHKGSNVEYFRRKYGISRFVVVPDPGMPRGTIQLALVDDRKINLTVNRTDLPVT